MTNASYAARASASVHLLSAQLSLAPDPEAQAIVRELNELRAELQRPVLRLLPGGGRADNQ